MMKSQVSQKRMKLPSLIDDAISTYANYFTSTQDVGCSEREKEVSIKCACACVCIRTCTHTLMRKAASSLARQGGRPFSQTASLKTPSGSQITTLPNKLRVATESTPGHFSSVGLYVNTGSRYEDASTSGVSHFLDRMAFKVRSP